MRETQTHDRRVSQHGLVGQCIGDLDLECIALYIQSTQIEAQLLKGYRTHTILPCINGPGNIPFPKTALKTERELARTCSGWRYSLANESVRLNGCI
jgi:hypothetical protein